jgi:hypothetical protein
MGRDQSSGLGKEIFLVDSDRYSSLPLFIMLY